MVMFRSLKLILIALPNPKAEFFSRVAAAFSEPSRFKLILLFDILILSLVPTKVQDLEERLSIKLLAAVSELNST